MFDVDNTLVQNWPIYDEAYRRTSLKLLGREFIMTRNPDGTEDRSFARLSNPQILGKRLNQLFINILAVDPAEFFAEFDRQAVEVAQDLPTNIYPGVERFLAGLDGARLVLLTSGTMQLQFAALRPILNYFDLPSSLFCGGFKSKEEALEIIADEDVFRNFVHVGDAPSDMKASVTALVAARKKLSVGVVLSGLVTHAELGEAGADIILTEYSEGSLYTLRQNLLFNDEAPEV